MSFDRDHGYPARPARRRALQAVATLGVAHLADALADTATPVLAFSPAAFDVHADHALIWVATTGRANVHVRFGRSPDALSEHSASMDLSPENGHCAAVRLRGVPQGVVIYYRVFAGDQALGDVARFHSARRSGQSLTLVFSGDMEERYRPFRLFDVMAAQRPDVFVHLGDTVYADIPKREFSPTLAHYRRKHARIRADLPLQSFLAQCATSAIWDDHEIENDANGSMPQLAVAEQAFREFWPCDTMQRSGLYRALRLSPDVELMVLDTRRFRSVQSLPDGAQKTMLGSVQKAWFLDVLAQSKAQWKIVATSVPFHGSSADAWGNYRSERDEIVEFIKRQRITGVVMISADYHFAREWSNRRTGIREFMAGPIATFRTFDRKPEAREQHSKGPHFVFGDDLNFGLLHYDGARGTLGVRYHDSTGATRFDTLLPAP